MEKHLLQRSEIKEVTRQRHHRWVRLLERYLYDIVDQLVIQAIKIDTLKMFENTDKKATLIDADTNLKKFITEELKKMQVLFFCFKLLFY